LAGVLLFLEGSEAMGDLLSVKQACEEFGFTEPKLRYEIRHGHLPVSRIGWALVLRRADVERLRDELAERAVA
jgi:hypothetical protein